MNKEEFYNKYKNIFSLDESLLKWKFINNAFSMKDKTLKIYINEIRDNDILYFQLLNFKTKEPISGDIYYIYTNNLRIKSLLQNEYFIDLEDDIVQIYGYDQCLESSVEEPKINNDKIYQFELDLKEKIKSEEKVVELVKSLTNVSEAFKIEDTFTKIIVMINGLDLDLEELNILNMYLLYKIKVKTKNG